MSRAEADHSLYPPIGDYAPIGDCRTLALVTRTAAIEWWCVPRFDAPSLFGAILDRERGGSWHLEAPRIEAAGRRYLPGTAVLETRVRIGEATLAVTDFLAVAGDDDADRDRGDRGGGDGAGRALGPEPRSRQKLVRLLRCESGRARFAIRCVPRPGYGTRRPRLVLAGPPDARRRTLALRGPDGARPIRLGATIPWGPITNAQSAVTVTLETDQEIGLVIDHGPGDPLRARGDGGQAAAGPVERTAPYELDELHAWLDETLRFWHDWTAVSDYRGPYRALVERSAITLKLLTYQPTGAIVAAGTTSLPEAIGGERNWDYRYTWLRDATFTLYSLHTLGYRREADAFMRWILGAARSGEDPLVMYRVDGLPPLHERTLGHLAGYRSSRPVRVGNAAAWQRQLDLYGEVLDAAYLDARAGNRLTDEEWDRFATYADWAATRWRRPDASIWEMRGRRRHFTYSKVMCWVALDRASRLAAMLNRLDHEADRVARWKRVASEIRATVMRRGRRADGAFAQSYGSDAVDASALVFPLVGFIRADSPTAEATLRAVQHELSHDGLVLRYRPAEEVEGVSGREGAFLICSYWLADNLALRGDLDGARRQFEWLSTHANDVGIFSEEWDPVTGEALGNIPQAFTHIALISTAHNLERARQGRMHGRVRGDAPGD